MQCIPSMLIKSLILWGFWCLCLIQYRHINQWRRQSPENTCSLFLIFNCSLCDPISISYCPSICTEFKMLPGPSETSIHCFYQCLQWNEDTLCLPLHELSGIMWWFSYLSSSPGFQAGDSHPHIFPLLEEYDITLILTLEEDVQKRGSVPGS